MRGVTGTRKPPKTFAEIDAARQRYNPKVQGYGNPDQWKRALWDRLDMTDAETIVFATGKSARKILKVYRSATWSEVRSAYKREAFATHPDRILISGMTKEEAEMRFKEVKAAYTVLAGAYGK